MTLYLLRYYDWDWESGYTIGIFGSMTDVHAYLVDEWEGRFCDANVLEPEPSTSSVSNYPATSIKIDEYGHGAEIEIEKIEFEP